ncbi:MAG: hypothetical protein RPT25_13315 [Cycloclasticus sp.]
MHNLIFIVDNFERAAFFERFSRSLKDMGGTAIYLTGCYQTYKYLTSIGRSVYHLGKNNQIAVAENAADVRKSIEVLSHDITANQAIKLANIYKLNLSGISFPAESIVVSWNGHQLISLVCQGFFKANYNYEYKFMEISNLPGKLFVDSKGVNAASSLSLSPELIDDYSLVDEDVHAQWLLAYQKSKQGAIGQAKNIKALPLNRVQYSLIGRIKGYAAAFDFANLVRPSWLRNKLSRKVNLASVINTSQPDLSDKYVLYPMQVSSDTQILINGAGYDNDSAIQYCIAKYSGNHKVVVKPHPAEKNLGYFLALYDKYKDDVIFVLSDTNKLIGGASHVVTINSTVGLEAMIQGKQITVLGESLYKGFDKDRLIKYIHSFLVNNVDYFSGEEISTDSIREIFKV